MGSPRFQHIARLRLELRPHLPLTHIIDYSKTLMYKICRSQISIRDRGGDSDLLVVIDLGLAPSSSGDIGQRGELGVGSLGPRDGAVTHGHTQGSGRREVNGPLHTLFCPWRRLMHGLLFAGG
jgi:hypothetical protein